MTFVCIEGGGAVDAHPNSVKKGSEIRILPEIYGFGESIWENDRRACIFKRSFVLQDSEHGRMESN